MLLERFKALLPLITDICRIAGTPSVSFGVLHHGEVVYQENLGYRDLDARLPSDNNTIYLIASLTKAFTAAMVGILVEEGKLSWTTQLQELVPEFVREDTAANVTITDLLSHRTGLPSYDALWLLSDNNLGLGRADVIPILNYVPVAAPLRTEFIYNNMAYEALGQVIEKTSGTDYASFLRERILEPLGMSQTFYTDFPVEDEQAARPYTALRNATPIRIPEPVHGKNILIGASGGIRSSVRDMLRFYKAYIDAAHAQVDPDGMALPQNPLKQLEHIWRGGVSLSVPSIREFSYASGWMRAQLPAPLADYGPGTKPMLGEGLPSRLGLFHGGEIPGFTSFAAVFPETSSAVVVLANSLPLTDSVRLVGQLLIEELFGNTINATHYVEYASSSSRQSASFVSDVKKELLAHKTAKTPAHPLMTYVGRYYNSLGNYFLDICEFAGRLRVSYMGRSSDTFDLEPYQYNSFFWSMSHDELAQRARYTIFPKEYYILEFGQDGDGGDARSDGPSISYLRWKHEFALEDAGEVFRKRDEKGTYAWRQQQQKQLAVLFDMP